MRNFYVTTVDYKQRGLASARDLQRLREYLGDLYPFIHGRWVTNEHGLATEVWLT